MKVREYVQYDGVGLSNLIAKQEITPTELATVAAAAIDAVNPQIDAVVEKWSASTSPDAQLQSPLYGVPLLIKDLAISLEGKKSELGSRLAEGLVMDADSTLMSYLKQAGFVTIGRTATPEFAISTTTEPRSRRPTRNPWNLAYNAGGSSGGAGAAVASGMVPIAHATDGGGSLRVPASINGVFGLKPTRGRVSGGPALDEVWSGLVCQLCVSRSVRDSAAMLDAIGVPAIGEPYYTLPPANTFLNSVNGDPRGLRIGLMMDPPNGSKTAPSVAAVVNNLAKFLEGAGHTVEISPFNSPVSWEGFVLANAQIWSLNTAAWIDFVASTTDRPINGEFLEPATLATYAYGKTISGFDVLGAVSSRNAITRALGHYFQRFDVLMTPTLPDLPLKIGAYNLRESELDGLGWVDHVFTQSPFAALANIAGVPSMSVPSGFDSETGLPIGTMFTAGFGNDSLLFSLAGQIERALPWKQHLPPVWADRQL